MSSIYLALAILSLVHPPSLTTATHSSSPSSVCIITAHISFIDDIPFDPSMMHPAGVWLEAHAFDHLTGAAPSPQDIYSHRVLLGSAVCAGDGTCSLSVDCNSESSKDSCIFAIIAFQSFDGSGTLRLDLAGGGGKRTAAIGWYHTPSAFTMSPVTCAAYAASLPVALNSISPLPPPLAAPHGSISVLHNHTLVRLWGSASERGHSHGCLLGAHIIQHFRFFTLETTTDGPIHYEHTVLPFVRATYTDDAEYREETAAVIAGARNCNHSLLVPELGRDFNVEDLLYLNTYGTYAEWAPGSSSGGRRSSALRLRRKACTQVAAWGRGSSDGGTIAGRNMDGENDFRKSTVLHLVVFAIEPPPPLMKFIHVFWPGMVGTASGLNEAGVHVMDNDGPSQPLSPRAPIGVNATSDGWTQRNLLARARSLADAQSVIAAHAASTGGTCIAGCNIMIALPFSHAALSAAAAAFVYEGDRMSGGFRLPNVAPPFTRSGCVIAVTNHYLNYGFDPAFPFRNFGVDILSPKAPGGDFSTLWRYAAVSAAIVARDDAAAAPAAVTQRHGGLAFEDIQSMLQGAAFCCKF
jgi:hypothetical protein